MLQILGLGEKTIATCNLCFYISGTKLSLSLSNSEIYDQETKRLTAHAWRVGEYHEQG